MKNFTFIRGLSFPVLIILALMMFGGYDMANAQAINTKKNYIRIDQFGYTKNATKIAVIAKAVNGFNSGTGIDLNVGVNVQVRRAGDNTVMYQAKASVWNGGGTDNLSGDRGWWFDFSSVTAEGDYYIRVTETNGNTVNSNNFKISDDVYTDVLRTAMEAFYYQRISQNKTAAYGSGGDWTDTPWYMGTNQDTNAKYLYGNERRDVSKGWIDAGDPNKYITFAVDPVHNLLTTYDQHPDFWKNFSLRIPEANNGLPDILDEVKWELDWIKKMQRSDGSVHSKAGIKEDFNYITPPSTDTRERYFAQTCPAAAITASGMMAHAAVTLGEFPSESSYVSDLIARAENAWDAYESAPDKSAICDNGEIEAGDADGPGDHFLTEHVAEAVCAAVYLYAATGKAKYNNFVKNNYTQTRAYVSGDWGIYRSNQSEAILYYTTLSNADANTKNAILNKKNAGKTEEPTIYTISDNSDFYRINPFYLNWGSNSLIARQGSDNYDYINYNIDAGDHARYQKTADGILHYFHGVNPFGVVYLTNMYNYGAELCVDQLWHTWFFVNDKYDGPPNPSANVVGPAPGFVVGGANPQTNGNTVISLGGIKYNGQTLGNQPDLKAFSDENNYIVGENESPFALVEPAIYYQSGYIKFLANYVATFSPQNPQEDSKLEAETNFSIVNEAGSNFAIAADGSSGQASGGQFVRLFDTNDEIRINFSVDATGNYELRARVRVGEQSGTSTNLKDQYEIRVDGTIRTFILDNSSVSGLDGDTYWGDLVLASTNLSNGNHNIRIRAKSDWLKVDYIEYSEVQTTGNVTVNVRGVNGEEQFRLLVDDVQVGDAQTVTTSLAQYTFNVANISGNFKVEFFNDGNGRDLFVDWIKVGDNTIQSEDRPVNTGTWQGQCGGTLSEWLHCNGYIDYGSGTPTVSGDIVVNARGFCGGEQIELRVDDVAVQTWTLTTSNTNYTYSNFNGSANIKVAFVNDQNNGCDYNIAVNTLTLCGTTYQTATTSTRTGCGFEEQLYCNGNFNFGTLTCGGSNARQASPSINQGLEQEIEGLSIYPNPSNDEFVIQAPFDNYRYSLIDVSGRTMANGKTEGSNTTKISVLHLPRGMYLLNLKSSIGNYVRKVLIE